MFRTTPEKYIRPAGFRYPRRALALEAHSVGSIRFHAAPQPTCEVAMNSIRFTITAAPTPVWHALLRLNRFALGKKSTQQQLDCEYPFRLACRRTRCMRKAMLLLFTRPQFLQVWYLLHSIPVH